MTENIEAVEKQLWTAADKLRSGSELASNEYFMPVMGLIFLRHAYSRYLAVKPEIEKGLPSRGGVIRPLTKEDFSSQGAIFLKPEAQFEYLVKLPDGADRAEALIAAMEAIESDYLALKGVLPKNEYQSIPSDVLASVLRIFNDEALARAKGDVFGRIYEYFLTQFADQSAHDGGEFFTPPSIVQMIVNAIEPNHGKVFDPACGSGGMFVQSAHFIERMKKDPTKVATFYGQEKNGTTIRLAKMNLAVHGLEGKIEKGITYYERADKLIGACDFVMANPPFNVDEVDAEKIKKDPRLPFGLPGVNKKKRTVSNGNYLWISYFYSYLTETGRAGFVMSSQASSAGGEEAKVRQKLIETGDVGAMIAIRGNFFYTRSVPCELWILNRNKPEHLKDKVLMLDARQVFRTVSRKVKDFSPEQLRNLTSIFWLYRGQQERFRDLVGTCLSRTAVEGLGSLLKEPAFTASLEAVCDAVEAGDELSSAIKVFAEDWVAFTESARSHLGSGSRSETDMAGLLSRYEALEPMAEASRDLIKQIDHLYKMAEKAYREAGGKRGKASPIKALEKARSEAVEALKQVRYFHRQAHWLLSRFPDGELAAVPGLVKLVDHDELEANDWSLTPGRYVGVAPEVEDEDFDFEETMHDIHVELKGLNEEASKLAAQIQANFEGMGL